MAAIAEFRSEPTGGVTFSKNGAFTQPFGLGVIQKKLPSYEDFFWNWLDNQVTPDRYIGYFWLFNVGDVTMTSIKVRPSEQLACGELSIGSTPISGVMQLHQYSLKVMGTSGSGIVEQVDTTYQKNSVEAEFYLNTTGTPLDFYTSSDLSPTFYDSAPSYSRRYSIPNGERAVGYTVTHFQVDDIPPGCGRKISVQFHPICLTQLGSRNHSFTVEFI